MQLSRAHEEVLAHGRVLHLLVGGGHHGDEHVQQKDRAAEVEEEVEEDPEQSLGFDRSEIDLSGTYRRNRPRRVVLSKWPLHTFSHTVKIS